MRSFVILAATLALLHPSVQGRSATLPSFPGASDQVTSLPGFDKNVSFNHYSGYLDSIRASHVHYWFFESQNDPTNDPLVLWLNGGPGCSSVLGALSEHGPFQLNKDGKLSLNPYAWNQRANVLYLESPAGVGFSYNDAGDYRTGDNETALLNYGALKSFLEKFPQFQNSDFYIAGESYGGIYVPTLSKIVVDNEYPKKFLGFALGNAFLDQNLNINTQLYFYYYHGLISASQWSTMLRECCPEDKKIGGEYCDFYDAANDIPKCELLYNDIQSSISRMPLNLYNIYGTCEATATKKRSFSVLHPESAARVFYNRRNLLTEGENPPCMNFDFMVDYLNRADVKKSLHIAPVALPWSPCSPVINGNYKQEYKTMHDIIKYLLHKGLRGLIYNGDIDAMCNYFGDELFTEKLGLKRVGEYRPWMLDGQIAGMVKFYQHLAFATIRGAGHTVPMDKPAQAKHMFDVFLTTKGDMADSLL